MAVVVPPLALSEAQMTKAHFPYRRVCIVVEPGGAWYILAKHTMHAANKAVRDGNAVFEAK